MGDTPPFEGIRKYSFTADPSLERDRYEALYSALNRAEYIHPDPLAFVRRFEDPRDQEIAGLLASSLAYGRVASIMASLERAFSLLPEPAAMLRDLSRRDLAGRFRGFRHRWTGGEDVAGLLDAASRVVKQWGTLECAFSAGIGRGDRTAVPALAAFVSRLRQASGGGSLALLSCPTRGSACKRLFLYLRWMVRRDEVDPGPWGGVSPSLLVVPMDVHMHRISLMLGITSRKQADLRCALQVTEHFRRLAPEDPVRYDFALTRCGIRGDAPSRAQFEAFAAGSRSVC